MTTLASYDIARHITSRFRKRTSGYTSGSFSNDLGTAFVNFTASDGRLTGGSVISNAAAGPAAMPSASMAWTIGTSPAVGMTNSVPASASPNIHKTWLSTPGPTWGNSQARAAPSSSTSTMYSGTSRSVMRAHSTATRLNGFGSAIPAASARACMAFIWAESQDRTSVM